MALRFTVNSNYMIVYRQRLIALCQILILCLLLFLNSGCQKETTLPSPEIKIISIETNSLITYDVVVYIDKGEGQTIRKAELVFDDITVFSAADVVVAIEINEERYQTDTIRIKIDRFAHDFSVKAIIETDQYAYSSENFVLRSLKNNFRFRMLNDNEYPLNQKSTCYANKGDILIVLLDYDQFPFNPNTLDVKLNRTISLSTEFDFNDAVTDGEIYTTGIRITLPENIDDGIYNVFVYVDSVEFSIEGNIQILKGDWSLFDESFPGARGREYAWFVLNDDLFVIANSSVSLSSNSSPVWNFNLKNKVWTQKKDFPHPGDISLNKIFSTDLVYNNTGYILLRNNTTIELWKYIASNDNWMKLTTYPGLGQDLITAFIIEDCLYIGGGSQNQYDIVFDQWAYSFKANEWKKCRDKPSNNSNNFSVSITYGKSAYIYEFAVNKLWEYKSVEDIWIEKEKFRGHDRMGTSFVLLNDNIYMIGGVYNDLGTYVLKDCWQYSITSDNWSIISFAPYYFNNNIYFQYYDKICVGLGYSVVGYFYLDDPFLYQLIP